MILNSVSRSLTPRVPAFARPNGTMPPYGWDLGRPPVVITLRRMPLMLDYLSQIPRPYTIPQLKN